MKNNFFILLILCSSTLFGADSLLVHIPVKTNFFTTDNHNNIYYISETNEIVRYNYSDSSKITYSNKTLGKAATIDAGNPLKVLVFYPDYLTIVLLDNKFAEIAVIKLNTLSSTSLLQPLAVCKENESDFIWLYDALSRKLIRFDETGNVIAQSEPFDQIFDFSVEQPQLFSAHDKVCLIDKYEGVFIFDSYANFDIELDLTTTFPAQFDGDYLITTEGHSVHSININSHQESILATFDKNILQANVRNDHLFVLTDEGIDVLVK